MALETYIGTAVVTSLVGILGFVIKKLLDKQENMMFQLSESIKFLADNVAYCPTNQRIRKNIKR